MECVYGAPKQPEVEIQTDKITLEDIVNGRMTFQRAFMSGAMKVKGDFRTLRMLDVLFPFEERKSV